MELILMGTTSTTYFKGDQKINETIVLFNNKVFFFVSWESIVKYTASF